MSTTREKLERCWGCLLLRRDIDCCGACWTFLSSIHGYVPIAQVEDKNCVRGTSWIHAIDRESWCSYRKYAIDLLPNLEPFELKICLPEVVKEEELEEDE
jgi:hypothetical protein